MKLACAERERVHNLSLRTAASVPGRSSGGRSPALRWLVMRAATNALMGPVDWQRSIIEVHFHIHQLSEGSGGWGGVCFRIIPQTERLLTLHGAFISNGKTLTHRTVGCNFNGSCIIYNRYMADDTGSRLFDLVLRSCTHTRGFPEARRGKS